MDRNQISSETPFAPGKVAVITGAASGIGRAAAERFSGIGMRIVPRVRQLAFPANIHDADLERGVQQRPYTLAVGVTLLRVC